MALDPGTTGVIINLVVGGVTITLVVLVFDFLLRKRLPTVFEYRKYLHDERPDVTDYQGNRVAALASPPSGFLGWMRGAWGVKLDENLERSHGPDQVMFLRFLRTQLWLFCTIGLIVAVLLPIYGTGPFKDLPEKDAEGNSTLKTLGIQIVTLSNIGGDDWRSWATLLADALITGVVWLFMWLDFKVYADARRRYRASRDNPSNYAIVVMDIDEESCSESHVFEYWNRLFPGQVVSVHYVHGDKKLLKKKARFWDAVMRRERAEWGMTNDPKLGGQRPTHKVGTCSCCNRSAQEVDSIEHWSGQQTHYYNKIGRYQIDKLPKQTPSTRSAIVVFATRRAAADAAQTNYARFQQSWKTSRAAEPDAVNWPSLAIKGATADVRKLVSFILNMLLTFFWVVPVTFLQGLANLEKLTELDAFSWLDFVNKLPKFILGLISGYLPPLILVVFLALIPVFIRLLVGIQRQHALGTVDALQRNYYFNFLVFSNLIFVALSGSVITYLRQLIDDPASIVTLLASSIPVQATFMINFILLLALSQVPLSLLQLGRGIVRWIFRQFLYKTTRQLRKADDGGCIFQYFRFYAWGMIVSTMALVYSTIAPLIVASAVLYFLTSYWVNKYCLLYTMRNPYESGGKLLKGAFTGIMIGLLLKQIVMAGVLGLKKQPVPAAVEGVFVFFTASFMYFIYTNYMRVAKHGSVLQMEESVEREGVPDMAADWIPPAYVSPGFQPLPALVPNLNGVDDVNEEAYYADDVELAKIKATKKAANLEEVSDEFMPAVGEPMPVTSAADETVPAVFVPGAAE